MISKSFMSYVAKAMFGGNTVKVGNVQHSVQKVGTNLRKVDLGNFVAIQQNPSKLGPDGKPTEGARLAQSGKAVVQFKSTDGRYIAVAVDGVVREYPS